MTSFTLPPNGPSADGRKSAEVGPQPGWYAVSVNDLYGYRDSHRDLRDSGYKYFRRFQPIAYAGYSIYIYHITAREAQGARQEMGLDY